MTIDGDDKWLVKGSGSGRQFVKARGHLAAMTLVNGP